MYGVFLIHSSNNLISNCKILCDKYVQNEFGFRISPGKNNNEIINCQIYNCDTGFDIQSSNNKMIGNIIRDCGLQCFWIYTNVESGYFAKNNTVSGNTLFEVGDKIGWGYGIWIHYSVENKIINNSISNKYCGLHVEVYSDDTVIKNNEIFNNRDIRNALQKSFGYRKGYMLEMSGKIEEAENLIGLIDNKLDGSD